MVETRGRWAAWVLLPCAVAMWTGCDDSSTGGAPANLSIRVEGTGAGTPEFGDSCHRLDDISSPAIQTLQAIVRSPSGAADCCVAFDPCDEMFSESRRLVLSLPTDKEPVDVSVAAFAGEFASLDHRGAAGTCATVPKDIGSECAAPCEAFPLAAGSVSDVTLKAGRTTIVTITATPALSLSNEQPECGKGVLVPERLIFQALSIPVPSEDGVSFEIVQDDGGRQPYNPEVLVPTSTELGLQGFVVDARRYDNPDNPTKPLGVGGAEVRIRFPIADGESFVEASYPVTILPSPTATPSPSPTDTATPSRTFTPTSTNTPPSPVILSIFATGGAAATPVPTIPCRRHLGGIESDAIRTLQAIVKSESGAADCCVAFDACAVGSDDSHVIDLSVPGDNESADVTIAAFSGDVASVEFDEVPRVCDTIPANIGRGCDPSCETFPIAGGVAREISLTAGERIAVPIDPEPKLGLSDLDPACGAAVVVPDQLSFTAYSIPTTCPDLGTVEIVQQGGGRQSYSLEVSGPTTGEFDLSVLFVEGFRNDSEPNEPNQPNVELESGAAQVRVRFLIDDSSESYVEASYPIEILPSPTPSPTFSPPLLLTPTPTEMAGLSVDIDSRARGLS